MRLSKIAFRNIRRNPRRTVLSATAVAVASLAIVLMFSLLHGMIMDMKWNITSYITGDIRLRNREYNKYETMNPVHLNIKNGSSLTESIDKLPEIAITAPRLPFSATAYIHNDSCNLRGIGVDFKKERMFQNLGKYMVKGSIPGDESSGAVMGYKLAKNLGLDIGDTFTVLTTTVYRGTNAVTFKVSGLAAFSISGLNGTTFYAPLKKVQRLTKSGDSVTEILAKVSRGTDLKTAEDKINSLLKKKGDMSTEAIGYTSLNTTLSLMNMARSAYDIIALIFFVLASSVIGNTTMMVIFERRKEIGTMSAMGMTGGQIQKLFFLESLYIGIIGSLTGVIAGAGIVIPLSLTGIDFGTAMEGVDFEISNIIKPVLDFKSTAGVFLYSITVASISVLIPARKAAHIEPAEALKSIGSQ